MSRAIEKNVAIAAPADAVWRALTEAEELIRWFPVEARVEPGPGGSIWISWGAGVEGTGAISAWQPGRQFGWTESRGPAKLAVDFHLETTGGTTVVRLVQSGFGDGPEWDDEFHMTEGGWAYFLAHLRWYLEKHRGRPRDLIALREPSAHARPEAYRRLTSALGRVRTSTLVESRETQQIGLALPDLNDAVLFIEIEPADSGSRPGFWLSTYGLSPAQLEAARREFTDLYQRALA